MSRLSVAGDCEVCGRPICQACWAIKKARLCARHTAVEATAALDRNAVASSASTFLPSRPTPIARRDAAEDPAAVIQRLRAAGRAGDDGGAGEAGRGRLYSRVRAAA